MISKENLVRVGELLKVGDMCITERQDIACTSNVFCVDCPITKHCGIDETETLQLIRETYPEEFI